MLGTSNEPGIMILAVREIFDKMRAISNRSFILRYKFIVNSMKNLLIQAIFHFFLLPLHILGSAI